MKLQGTVSKRLAPGFFALLDQGYAVTPTVIARLSPCKTEHINHFGRYELRFDQVPPPSTEELRLSPAISNEASIG